VQSRLPYVTVGDAIGNDKRLEVFPEARAGDKVSMQYPIPTALL